MNKTKLEKQDTTNLSVPTGAFSIGRADDNDMPVLDKTVSAHHARIFTYLNSSYIEDLGSTNGTYLNGRRIQKHTLQTGDKVRIGKLELEVNRIESSH